MFSILQLNNICLFLTTIYSTSPARFYKAKLLPVQNHLRISGLQVSYLILHIKSTFCQTRFKLENYCSAAVTLQKQGLPGLALACEPLDSKAHFVFTFVVRGPVTGKPRKLFGPVKPFLVYLHLKTEKCMRLKLLVRREFLFMLTIFVNETSL